MSPRCESNDSPAIEPITSNITQLLEWGVLRKVPGGGRSTGYELAGL